MADFPVVALWGNENAELLFFISLVWELFVGIFGGQSGIQESLGTSYFQFILQMKGLIWKWIFSCLDEHISIRQDYSE